MAPLLFECPRTRRTINAGIEMDKVTLAAIRPVKLRLYCSHCRRDHDFAIHCGRLSDNWTRDALVSHQNTSPRVSIAINSLRISELKSGLIKASTA
jgi:hypothetical protein